MLRVIATSLLLALATASPLSIREPSNLATCAFPNNTNTALHMYSCAQSSDTITVKDVIITDVNGNPMYPIDPRKPFILVLKSHNAGVQINDNKVDVQLFEYKSGWSSGTCSWTEMPTFGLLNGIDGCDFANNCPLTVGDLDLKIQLDLSAFSAIISLLSSNTPVQLDIRMKNNNVGSKHEEIACVVAQLKIT